jgi:hypothetical protein
MDEQERDYLRQQNGHEGKDTEGRRPQAMSLQRSFLTLRSSGLE